MRVTRRDAVKRAIFGAAALAWGLSDRHMWTPGWRERPDGLANRMLPLDDQYQPKPMMVAIERFCLGSV